MDVFAVPSKSPAKADPLSRDTTAGVGVDGLIATFSDLLRNAGLRMEHDAGTLISRTRTATARRDAEPAARAEDPRAERRTDAPPARADRPRRSRDGNERTPANEAQSADNRPAAGKADGAKTPASAASDTDAPAKAKPADDRAERPAATDTTDATGGATAPAAGSAPPDQAAATGQAGDTAAASAAAVAPATSATATDVVAGVLAAQLFAHSEATGGDPVRAAADTVSAVDDLSVSVIAAGLTATGGTAAPGFPAPASPVAVTAAPVPQMGTAAADPQVQDRAAGNAAINPTDLKVQQAAALSRLTGEGNLIAVRTTVTQPSAQLVSQPTANLSASIVAAAESMASTAPAIAQMAQTASTNPSIQAAAAQGEAGPLVLQNQQAEAQLARAQGASATGDAAKPLVQAAGPAQPAGLQTSTGGGDGLAGGGAQAAPYPAATQAASQPHAAGQARFTVPQHAVVDQVSVQISKAVKDGIDRIHIQLRPEHMGRVDVRLEVTDGRVAATVTADSKETLDMLQRDARELERALQQAGLQTDAGSLNFSLRGQQGQGEDGGHQTAGGPTAPDAAAAEAAADATAWTDYPDGIRPDGRIDIRA